MWPSASAPPAGLPHPRGHGHVAALSLSHKGGVPTGIPRPRTVRRIACAALLAAVGFLALTWSMPGDDRSHGVLSTDTNQTDPKSATFQVHAPHTRGKTLHVPSESAPAQGEEDAFYNPPEVQPSDKDESSTRKHIIKNYAGVEDDNSISSKSAQAPEASDLDSGDAKAQADSSAPPFLSPVAPSTSTSFESQISKMSDQSIDDATAPAGHAIDKPQNSDSLGLNMPAGALVSASSPPVTQPGRQKACLVILCRNSDVRGVMAAMRQVEERFNRQYNYPYVFLNDEPFSDAFKAFVRNKTAADTEFGLIPKEMWSYPDWIDQDRAARERAHLRGVPYGSSEPYRHMCRFYSGFFWRHPLLMKYDYYWRVEPHIHLYCDMDFDPFERLATNNMAYGFTITLHEVKETVPTLWKTVLTYAIERDLESDLLGFAINWENGDYNGCHFWSNFEIGSLNLWRSTEYVDFFDYLDRAGGFFYERWGDAPVHSLAVLLFVREKDSVHFFRDIGYRHDLYYHCYDTGDLAHKCICPDTKWQWHDRRLENYDVGTNTCLDHWQTYQPKKLRVRDLFELRNGDVYYRKTGKPVGRTGLLGSFGL